MDYVRLHPLTQCLEFLFSLFRINNRGSSGGFLRERRRSVVILCRNKKVGIFAGEIVIPLHGKEMNLMTGSLETFGETEVIRFRSALEIVEFVNKDNLHLTNFLIQIERTRNDRTPVIGRQDTLICSVTHSGNSSMISQ